MCPKNKNQATVKCGRKTVGKTGSGHVNVLLSVSVSVIVIPASGFLVPYCPLPIAHFPIAIAIYAMCMDQWLRRSWGDPRKTKETEFASVLSPR